MKKILLIISFCTFFCNEINAQYDVFWKRREVSKQEITICKIAQRESFPDKFDLYEINFIKLKKVLFQNINKKTSNKTIISLPNAYGNIEEFEIFEASNFEPALQEQFPEIRTFSGKGITDKFATLKLSISPEGIQTMVFRIDKPNEFMEPYSTDAKLYAVYFSQRKKSSFDWSCSTKEKEMADDISNLVLKNNYASKSSDGKLRVMRLAQSCTGEYAAFFGASVAGTAADQAIVLTRINNTLARCNGVYEKDLGLHLNLVANSTAVFYYDATTDPFSSVTNANSPPAAWNTELQATLTSIIGDSNYDIGHLFGASGGGGNAGCIGCFCGVVDTVTADWTDLGDGKGSGITSPATGGVNSSASFPPAGDNFDIDYVVHEIGHQLGMTHSFTFAQQYTPSQMEVGSGITIMGYAGITSSDFVPHSIDAYHAYNIAQYQKNVSTKLCPVVTNISSENATPTVSAGSNYTIPISTPFALTAVGNDANANDVLTYSWEQYNVPNSSQFGATASNATVTKASGPNFASWNATSSPTRIFPKMSTVLLNSKITAGIGGDAGMNSEALPSVNRILNFRVTVRDNVPYSSVAPFKVGQTNFADMIVTTNNSGGPFTVSSQNVIGISYVGLSAQTITWNKGNTPSTPFNTSNVKISLSTDNGLNFSILLASTPNDGTEVLTIPDGINSTNCRIKIEALGNIFFNVNTTKFTIIPSNLAASEFEFKDFSLYPNPNNGNFTLKFNSASLNDIKINVFDMRGRNVFEKSFSNTGSFNQDINLDKVQAGIYLVSISDGNIKTVKRIVVQ